MFKSLLRKLKFHWPILLLLTAYFILAWTKYKDFGISSNAQLDYANGIAYIEHFSEKKVNLEQFNFFDRPLIDSLDQTKIHMYGFYTGALVMFNTQKSVAFFNFLNLSFFSILLTAAYSLLYKKYKSPILALIGPIFILLSPRLIGHVPINPTYISFTISFFASLTALFYFSKKSNKILKSFFVKTIVLGILFGFSQASNILGYGLYFIFIFQIFHTLIFRYTKSEPSSKLKFLNNSFMELVVILIVSHFFMLITFPYLASNFFLRLGELFQNTFYSQHVLNEKLFFGTYQNLHSGKYLATLAFFTLPVILLVLLPLSLYFIKKKIKDELYSVLLFTLIAYSVFFYIVEINAHLGIQDILFLMPVVAIFCSIILIELLLESKDTSLSNLFSLIIFVALIGTAYDMIVLHPYQYNYYNELGGGFKNMAPYFEKDYFGLSFKEAVESLPETSQEKLVEICANTKGASKFLTDNYTVTDDSSKADFIICDFPIFDIEPAKTISRQGVILNSVTSLNN